MWVDVGPGEVAAYECGSGADVILLLIGGPSVPCDYLRDIHSHLIDHGYRVLAFDQLGADKSDRPTDPALWTIARFVAEVEAVRAAPGLGGCI